MAVQSQHPLLIAALLLAAGPAMALPPNASFDFYAATENGLLGVDAASGLLSNDSDPDGDSITVAAVIRGPESGSLQWTSDGQFTYTPSPGFFGADSFRYTLTDGTATSDSALVVIAVAPGTARRLPESWPTYGNGPSHSGYQPGWIGDAAPALRWEKTIGDSAVNPVVVAGNQVFVTPFNYHEEVFVGALNAATGDLIWEQPFDPAFSMNPPTYADGHIYVQRGNHGTDSQIRSLDALTGEVDWSTPFGAQWDRYYAPVVADGKVWVNAGTYGGLYGFDQQTGHELFFNDRLEQTSEWTPLYHDGRLFSLIGGTLREHDPNAGTIVRSVTISDDRRGQQNIIAIASGRMIYIRDTSSIAALSVDTMSVVWQAAIPAGGTPAVAGDLVYAIAGSEIWVFDAQTGVRLTVYTAPEDLLLVSQPLVTDDRLLVASDANTYMFDRWSGAITQTIPRGGKLTLAGNVLFVAPSSSNLLSAWTINPVEPAADLPPTVLAPIPDQQLDVGGSPGAIDLTRYFRDGDDIANAMRFFLLDNTNGNVVDVAISGGQLLLTPTGLPGDASLTIRANSGGLTADVTFNVHVENPALRFELFDANGNPVVQGVPVSGVLTGRATVLNHIGDHAQFYQNFRVLHTDQPGHMVDSASWQRTFRVDTARFYDGDNLISMHVHPHNAPGMPYGADFDVGLFRVTTFNNNPAPNGDTELPTAKIAPDKIRFTGSQSLPGKWIFSDVDAVKIFDDSGQIDIDQLEAASNQAQVITHLGASVLGRFRWLSREPPFGDSVGRVFDHNYLINFQRETEYDAKLVFFFNDAVGRANYGLHRFRMPALAPQDAAAFSVPRLDARFLNVHQGDEIVVPAGGSFTAKVEINNVQSLGSQFRLLSTWVGNRSVATTDLGPMLRDIPPDQERIVVDVQIPADEIRKLQDSRFGGVDSTAFAIWNDFAIGASESLPTSEHQHLSSIRTSDIVWPYSTDVDGDGINVAGDNCPIVPNPQQVDSNGDGAGDACDPDDDGDGILDAADTINLAPTVEIAVTQQGRAVTTVAADAGPVTSVAILDDPNPGDSLGLLWSTTPHHIAHQYGATADRLEFTPMTAGLVRENVTVHDDGVGQLTGTDELVLRVVAASPTLTSDDSDGDGVDDQTEGTGDSDSDRIPDYLDATAAPELLPVHLGGARLVAEAGRELRLGEVAFAAGQAEAAIDWHTLRAHGGLNGGPGRNVEDSRHYYLWGVVDFEIHAAAPGGRATVVLPLTAPLDADTLFRLRTAYVGWSTFQSDGENALSGAPGQAGACPPPGAADYRPGLSAGDECIQLTLTDGGPNDTDGTANRWIHVTGGPAATQMPPLDIEGRAQPTSAKRFARGSGEQVVLKFVLNSSEDAELKTIRIRVQGGLDQSAVRSIFVYADADGDGQPAIEERVGEGTFDPAAYAIAIELTEPLRLPTGDTPFLVTYEFLP